MGIMVYSLIWDMQDFVHQPYYALQCPVPWPPEPFKSLEIGALAALAIRMKLS